MASPSNKFNGKNDRKSFIETKNFSSIVLILPIVVATVIFISHKMVCADSRSISIYGTIHPETTHIIEWDIRKRLIERAIQHRNADLGPELLPRETGMGDISSSGAYDQIKAYSDWAAQPWAQTACEVGFAIGTSSIVYLESNPNIRVIAFDIMALPKNASQRALAYLEARYGKHRIQVIEGNSQTTLPKNRHKYGGVCDLISVDGMHDASAYKDFLNMRPYANPSHHVLLADDCVSRGAFERIKTSQPQVRWFGDVWESWRRLVDEDGIIAETDAYLHGGEGNPIIETFSNFIKGWCEGAFVLSSK